MAECKETEQALKESEERFRMLFTSAPIPLVHASLDGKVIAVNDFFIRILGYTTNDIPDLAHWWIKAYPDPDYRSDVQSAWEKAIKQAIAADTDVDGEYHVTCKNGSVLTMIMKANIIGNTVVVSFQDVTKIREKESELKASIELIQATLNATTDGILVVNKEMKIMQANQQFYQMWHIPPVLQQTDDDNALREFVKDQLVDPDGFQNMVLNLYHSHTQDMNELAFKDGRIFGRYSAPVVNEGKEMGRVWYFRDITEYKQAEQEIKDSEVRFRTLFKMAPISMADISRDERILDLNDYFIQTIGYTTDDIPTIEDALGISIQDSYFRNEMAAKWRIALGDAIANNSNIPPIETPLLFKDQSIHDMIINTRLIADRVIVSFFDITEHKKTKDAIDFERRQLLSIFDSFDDLIYVADPVTYKVMFANRCLCEKFNKNPVGGICYREFQGFDKPCEFCTNDIIMNNGGKPYRWEYHNPLTNIDVDIVDQSIRWPDGRDVRLEIASDITERNRTETALKNSEKKLRSIFTGMKDIIIIFDSEGYFIEIAPTNTHLLPLPAEELVGKNIRDLYPPEKANEFLTLIHEALSGQNTVWGSRIDNSLPECLVRIQFYPIHIRSGNFCCQ